MDNQKETELDLVGLFYYLKKKFLIVVAAFLACAVVGFVVSSFFITPKYKASTRIYVLNRASTNGLVVSDFTISNQLLNDYKVLITGRNVTEKVIDRLGLNMSASGLAGKISVSAPEDTRIVQIDIVDTDPQRAANIANAVREEATDQLKNIMSVDTVTLVYEAEVPQNPTSPNVMFNTALAAMVGAVVAIGILGVIFMMDDTIRTEEDVERYLGLSVLAVIPLSNDLDAASKRPGETKKTKNIMSMRRK